MQLIASKMHTALFYALIFLLPVNIGKHFIHSGSYVGGILVDYLIPTIYLTDLIILFLLIFWIFSSRLYDIRLIASNYKPTINFLLIFFVAVGLSVLGSVRFSVSIHYFVRLTLYMGLFLYVISNINSSRHFYRIFALFSISTFLLSILGISQWINQGSVFNNYLILGEQPYNSATKNVLIESVFGFVRIPPYGLFRHPNIFGGFLSVILVWLVYYFVSLKNNYRKIFLVLTILLGIVALLLTFSAVALLVFVYGLGALLIVNKYKDKGYFLVLLVSGFLALSAIFLPFVSQKYPAQTERFIDLTPSVYRRINFSVGSGAIYSVSPLFGTGLNTNTIMIEEFSPKSNDIRFVQPVHNIFLLILSETGAFALIFFILFVGSIMWVLKANNIFGISIVQFLLLGSFDHYLLTIHQTQILFWLTLGLALTYNFVTYVKQT